MGIFCTLSVNVYNFICWFGDKEGTQFQIDQIFADSITVCVSKAHLGSTSGLHHTPTLILTQLGICLSSFTVGTKSKQPCHFLLQAEEQLRFKNMNVATCAFSPS